MGRVMPEIKRGRLSRLIGAAHFQKRLFRPGNEIPGHDTQKKDPGRERRPGQDHKSPVNDIVLFLPCGILEACGVDPLCCFSAASEIMRLSIRCNNSRLTALHLAVSLPYCPLIISLGASELTPCGPARRSPTEPRRRLNINRRSSVQSPAALCRHTPTNNSIASYYYFFKYFYLFVYRFFH